MVADRTRQAHLSHLRGARRDGDRGLTRAHPSRPRRSAPPRQDAWSPSRPQSGSSRDGAHPDSELEALSRKDRRATRRASVDVVSEPRPAAVMAPRSGADAGYVAVGEWSGRRLHTLAGRTLLRQCSMRSPSALMALAGLARFLRLMSRPPGFSLLTHEVILPPQRSHARLPEGHGEPLWAVTAGVREIHFRR